MKFPGRSVTTADYHANARAGIRWPNPSLFTELTETQCHGLNEMARRTGRSAGEIVRLAVTSMLKADDEARRAWTRQQIDERERARFGT